MTSLQTATGLSLTVLVLAFLGCASAADQAPAPTSRVSVTFVQPERIDLEFRLTDSRGVVVKEGRRTLRDPEYLIGAALPGSDRLRYDKQLLGHWLRRELGGLAALAAVWC